MKKDINLLQILRKPVAEYEKFHLITKLKTFTRNINPKYWPREWKEVRYKAYSRLDEIALPIPNLNKKTSLVKVFKKRKSGRDFSKAPLSMQKISNLLYYSAGLNKGKDFLERRFYPSAGARFPLEVYFVSLNSELPKGVYHYYIRNHSLEKLGDINKIEIYKIIKLRWVKSAGGVILIGAIFRRSSIKYGERAYRHVLVEAGHLSQNFYIISSALDIGCCAIGGYIDDKANKLVDIDGLHETIIYVLAIGEKKKNNET